MKKTVVVGLSGGVDSSVAALLLKEQGYNVIGLFMTNWKEQDENGCCTAEADFVDVKKVADTIGIPYYSIDFSKEYMDRVFLHFVEEYKKGRTPNPDVLCNREIKFGPFADFARNLGADYIATGHYCKIEQRNNRNYLLRARDENKDQTYFLNQVKNHQLDNVLFPVGDMTKPELREFARTHDIPTADKKDSTGVCFIGERNFAQFLKNYIPMQDGDIVTQDGKVVGKHSGVYYYTIGQRKGLNLGGTKESVEPWFVLAKDVQNNRLIVSQGEDSVLFKGNLVAEDFNQIVPVPSSEFECMVRIRHRQPLQKAIAKIHGNDVFVEFETKQRAVAGGQYAVLYDGQVCLGGGVIR